MPIIGWEHIGALVLATALLILFGLTGKRLSRWEGLVLLGGYVLYMGMLFEFIPTPFNKDDAPAAPAVVEEVAPPAELPTELDGETLEPTDMPDEPADDLSDELEGAPQ